MFTRYCEGDGLDDWAAHAVVRHTGVETLVVAGQVGQLQHGARGQRGGGHLALELERTDAKIICMGWTASRL